MPFSRAAGAIGKRHEHANQRRQTRHSTTRIPCRGSGDHAGALAHRYLALAADHRRRGLAVPVHEPAIHLRFFVGYTFLNTEYFYLLIAVLLPFTFLIFPGTPKAPLDRVPWYDSVLFVADLRRIHST